MKFQHVPIIVDAIQYDGTFSGAQAVSALLASNGVAGGVVISYDNGAVKSLEIPSDKADGDARVVRDSQWVYVTKDKVVSVAQDLQFNEEWKVQS